jgi:hypothetical protein
VELESLLVVAELLALDDVVALESLLDDPLVVAHAVKAIQLANTTAKTSIAQVFTVVCLKMYRM